jgi:hypothetical protein
LVFRPRFSPAPVFRAFGLLLPNEQTKFDRKSVWSEVVHLPGKADADNRNFSTHFPEDGEIRPSQIELHRMEVCNCYREMIKVVDSSCNGRESRGESESVARDSGGFRG